ncbi:NAD-binding protein [Rickenella mellea]|uniref:NAD-binding protein n=1 Tax=Rickenella mellea TaxID=50990 RepID=A0A4R5XER6_9AGAM|nr:NAD-binding protein [Rickenella mellea]
MSPIKTSILGVGLAGLTFHVPFVLALPELFQLHSVLERNPSSDGGKVNQRFGVSVKIYTSLEDILKEPEIELIIVCTPNSTHYPFAKAALSAGKHVLVDKPVTTTSAEARELGELAKAKNLVLYAYQNRRWDSDFLTLRRLLGDAASSPISLGDLFEFESHYDRYRTDLKGSWKDQNGITWDLGSHLIDQTVALFGRPEKVTGFINNLRGIGDADVDDNFTIHLHYPRSSIRPYPLTAILRAHMLSVRIPQLRYVIRGSKGTFTKYGLDVQEEQTKAIAKPNEVFKDDYGREPDSIQAVVENMSESGAVTRSLIPSEKGAYVELFRNLAAAIRKREEVKIKWDEVITVLEIIESAYRSSQEGRTVTLGQVSV